MLDMKFIRENPDFVRANLANRDRTAVNIDDVLAKDEARRKLRHETEQVRAEQNKASQDIANLKKAKEDASEAIAAMQEVSQKAKALGEQAKDADAALQDLLLGIPNLLHDSVPAGADETDNRFERRWGEPPTGPPRHAVRPPRGG